ncbi:S1 RNA-binding domain-containing protein [Streptomyces sp. NPDC051815]|uniref:S1 RNA-binding domain-containing protein n=1 Tax=Streptomyces sp. NPDC051815 TaxID=3365674 RepID=UPI003795ADF7
MGGWSDGGSSREFLDAIAVGDLCGGTVAEVTARGVSVVLDGFAARPLGFVGSLDLSWRRPAPVEAGDRITAAVIAVEPDQDRVWLSLAATENPGLWAFLTGLLRGETLSGRIAAIERFGVFVELDDGPAHPVFPGVGFITLPELSWRRFEDPSDVVRTGQRVSCEFLQFDTTNGEARLSLRATQPDPFRAFAQSTAVGRTLRGRVTALVPFGVFVQVADGVEGLVHLREPGPTPVASPEEAVRVGDEITVVVTAVDPQRRTLSLSRRRARTAAG